MNGALDRVAAARTEADQARARLLDTAHALQARLSPKTLARETWESAKVKGADLAEDAVDAVKRRPFAAGGAVAAIALFLAREPIKDLASRLLNGSDEDEDEDEDEETEKSR